MQLTPEMTYRETIAGLFGPTAGSPLDQYIRMSPQFETGDAELSWLTDTLWIGEGRLAGDHQIEYRIYRVD
jgi:Protein of unknown function (DUF3237)